MTTKKELEARIFDLTAGLKDVIASANTLAGTWDKVSHPNFHSKAAAQNLRGIGIIAERALQR